MSAIQLTGLWLISGEGNVSYRYEKIPASGNNSNLLCNFLSGIQKFMEDLGGGEFYQLLVKDTLIIGINFSSNNNQKYYLIGRFLISNQKDSSKCIKYLAQIQKLYMKESNAPKPETDAFNASLNKILNSLKIA